MSSRATDLAPALAAEGTVHAMISCLEKLRGYLQKWLLVVHQQHTLARRDQNFLMVPSARRLKLLSFLCA